jgi:hypothetical protein
MASSATPTDAAFRPFAKQLYKRLNPPFLRPTPMKLRTTNDPDVYHNHLLRHCMDHIFNVTATVPATSPFGGMRARGWWETVYSPFPTKRAYTPLSTSPVPVPDPPAGVLEQATSAPFHHRRTVGVRQPTVSSVVVVAAVEQAPSVLFLRCSAACCCQYDRAQVRRYIATDGIDEDFITDFLQTPCSRSADSSGFWPHPSLDHTLPTTHTRRHFHQPSFSLFPSSLFFNLSVRSLGSSFDGRDSTSQHPWSRKR